MEKTCESCKYYTEIMVNASKNETLAFCKLYLDLTEKACRSYEENK